MTQLALEANQTSASTVMRALTLELGDELFAIEATSVREIQDIVPVTEVPNAQAFVSGLINVRGRVVPLADLRVKFGMDRPPPDADTRIVVFEITLDEEPVIVGILADRVHTVTDLISPKSSNHQTLECDGGPSLCVALPSMTASLSSYQIWGQFFPAIQPNQKNRKMKFSTN